MKSIWHKEIISLFFITAALIFGTINWGSVPDRVAIHWNLAGVPDRYGSKFLDLVLMPLTALGIYVLLTDKRTGRPISLANPSADPLSLHGIGC